MIFVTSCIIAQYLSVLILLLQYGFTAAPRARAHDFAHEAALTYTYIRVYYIPTITWPIRGRLSPLLSPNPFSYMDHEIVSPLSYDAVPTLPLWVLHEYNITLLLVFLRKNNTDFIRGLHDEYVTLIICRWEKLQLCKTNKKDQRSEIDDRGIEQNGDKERETLYLIIVLFFYLWYREILLFRLPWVAPEVRWL